MRYYGCMQIRTEASRQIIDITNKVTAQLPPGTGVATVFVSHTTAAVTTADLDPGTDEDFLEFLQQITPQADWRHPHDPSHAPDHLLASLIGPGVTVPYSGGTLQLGTWQRVVLVELDGPRSRDIAVVMVNGEAAHDGK